MAAVNQGLEMARMLDGISDIALDMDSKGVSANVRYAPEDVMNALIIFMHVCSNVGIHKFIDKKLDMSVSLEKHSKNAIQLRNWVKRVTGVDPYQFFSQKHEQQ